MKDTPLIVQSDRSLLLDVHHNDSEACRMDLIRFCELVKSPEHMHTYRISEISLWNAASEGLSGDAIVEMIRKWSKYSPPESVLFFVRDISGRWGSLVLTESDDETYYLLTVSAEKIRLEIKHRKELMKLLVVKDENSFLVERYQRGELKLRLIKLGYPVDDQIPLSKGPPLLFDKRKTTLGGKPFVVRPYQSRAADALLGDLGRGCGFGTIVLPCGSGKTIVGLEIMSRLKTNTLIVTTNVVAVHQWMREILDKTTLRSEDVGEYTGNLKERKPVTVCTYQVLTYRKSKTAPFAHMDLLTKGDWGLVIYDEVHMLPAPSSK